MGPFKLKTAFVVLLNTIKRLRKTVIRMTFRAIRCYPLFNELLVMIIFVTIGTTLVPDRICKFCFMALLTIDIFMSTFKSIAGKIMIKTLDCLDLMK